MLQMPVVALSIRQPWAWAVAYGFKPVENRDWRASNPGLRFRGLAFIHAGLKEEKDDLDFVFDTIAEEWALPRGEAEQRYRGQRQLGGIVGVMEVVDVVTDMISPWFFGPYGLVIRNARPIPFVPCKGELGYFRPQVDSALLDVAMSQPVLGAALPMIGGQ